jgi:hypothetical protein
MASGSAVQTNGRIFIVFFEQAVDAGLKINDAGEDADPQKERNCAPLDFA